MVSLGAIGFDGLIVVDEVTGFGELAVCGGAILSGDLMVGGMILLQLNFSVNFLLVGIKCLRFLIMTFLFSFRTSHDRGQWFCFMTTPFLSQRFCSSVRILTAFSWEIFGREWVVLQALGVSVTNEFCGSKGLTEGRLVRS